MVEDIVYTTNDGTENGAEKIATSLSTEEADSLLLYQARQNVKDRKNLFRHVVAFIVVWPVLALFYEIFIQDMISPEWSGISNQLQILNEAKSHIPEDYLWAVGEVRWTLERHLFYGYTPAAWYVILGIVLAWGGWIAVRSFQRFAVPIKRKLRTIPTKKVKPDPVVQEYNRLKNMATDEIM